jgi:hypothetical protein
MAERLKRPKRVIESGPGGTVEYAIRLDGRMEARTWLESQSQTVQSSFVHLFRVHASGHKITNKEQFRQLTNTIFEYKRGGNRLFSFQNGSSWFVTHHYKKNGPNQCPKRVIQHAETIRIECLAVLQMESGK